MPSKCTVVTKKKLMGLVVEQHERVVSKRQERLIWEGVQLRSGRRVAEYNVRFDLLLHFCFPLCSSPHLHLSRARNLQPKANLRRGQIREGATIHVVDTIRGGMPASAPRIKMPVRRKSRPCVWKDHDLSVESLHRPDFSRLRIQSTICRLHTMAGTIRCTADGGGCGDDDDVDEAIVMVMFIRRTTECTAALRCAPPTSGPTSSATTSARPTTRPPSQA
jgi:hypothetical protein